MVNVYMNHENLEKRIAELEEYAQSAIEAQATVHCMYLNDPIKTGESLGSLESAVVKAANEIKSHAEELRRCKTTMVNLNSNGVASHDLKGGINLQVADDSAGLETTDKFEKWAQGATDAHDLSSGGGYPPREGKPSNLASGRSFDEVIESMRANKGDPTYANSVIDCIGPANLVKIGDSNPDNNRQAPVLGEVLATASQTWDKEKSERNADLIIGSAKTTSVPYGSSRVPIFNKMIGFHDANGDGVSDLKFGADFLLSLGQKAKAASDSVITSLKNGGKIPRRDEDPARFYDKFTSQYDPVLGVLSAMSCKENEEAARGFLAPNGGNAKDVENMDKLIARHEIGDNSWTNAWTGISSVTSEAHGADHYDGTTDSRGSASKQAAAIATSVVNRVGGHIMGTRGYDSISGAARSNLRKTVSCYPYAFDNIATGTGDPKSMEPGAPDQSDEAWSKGIGYQPKFTVAGLAGVTQTISRDENEFKALTESVGGIEERRMTHAIANRTGNPETDDELGTAIRAKSNVAAFLMGASRAPIEGDADAIDKRNNLIIDAVFAGTAYIPGLGENAKQIWKDSYEFAKSNATNMLKNEATDTFTGNLSAAMKSSGIIADQDSKAATVSTVMQLIELGYIDKNSVNETINVQEEDGKRVVVVNDEGKVDLSKMNGETARKVMDELYNRYAQESTHLKGDANEAFVTSELQYQGCFNMGRFGNKAGKQ